MKKSLYLFIYIAVALMILGCKDTAKQQTDNTIFVSIAPIKPLVEAIVADGFDVKVLVPAGASPETYEPTPKQFIELNNARMVFSTGLLDFEKALLDKVYDQSRVVNLSHGITTIAGSCSHTHHGKHCHHGIDPHIWCSPKSLHTMAQNISNALIASMPDSVVYKERYSVLNQRITDLDQRVNEMCQNASLPYFIIYHPALTYLARDYGLEQVAVENEGKETSAKRLSQIIDRARKDGVKRVFYQSEFPASSIEVVAQDIGAQAVEINPLAENVIENLEDIVLKITE